MTDFIIAKEKALTFVSKTNTVAILDKNKKKELGFSQDDDVWEIKTEILIKDNSVKEITLNILLGTDFPLTLPTIFLSQKDYEWTKYIPHIDSNHEICTYDKNIVRTNPDDPVGIISSCIIKAKNIIEEGISKINQADFDNEFLAYWNCTYEKGDEIFNNILTLVDEIQDNDKLYIISLHTELNGYGHILHKNDELARRIKNFLKDYDQAYTETNAFFLGEIKINIPPFNLSNKDVYEMIKNQGWIRVERFRNFINQKEEKKFVFGYKRSNQLRIYVGWLHRPLNLVRKGFRPGKIKHSMSSLNYSIMIS